MCDYDKASPVREANAMKAETKAYESGRLMDRIENHTVYELKQQREYHIQQIVKISQAIDALNRI